MSSLILYYDPLSPPARFVALVAVNLGLELKINEIDESKGEANTPEFKAINPLHSIPTLIDEAADNLVLWEPRTIATYLIESRFPNHSLYPCDPVKRAIINQRLYFDASTLIPRIYDIVYPLLFDETNEVPKEKADKMFEAFWWLNSFLEYNKWVAGDEMTVADLAFLVRIQGVVALGASLDNFAHLQRWLQQMTVIRGFESNEQASLKWAELVKAKIAPGKGF